MHGQCKFSNIDVLILKRKLEIGKFDIRDCNSVACAKIALHPLGGEIGNWQVIGDENLISQSQIPNFPLRLMSHQSKRDFRAMNSLYSNILWSRR
jgi:hypothetical protein